MKFGKNRIKFGAESEEVALDDIGSSVTTERNIRDFVTARPIRKHFKMRVKVANKQEELQEYLSFSDSLNESKLDPAFCIERTRHGNENGYYYIVKCWTELEK